jgi:hypothetical protein
MSHLKIVKFTALQGLIYLDTRSLITEHTYAHKLMTVLLQLKKLNFIQGQFEVSYYVYKLGGKQWQTTPKNLPRMQRTRAIPVA